MYRQVALIALASQILGALSALALPLIGLTNADLYAISLQVGNAPLVSVVFGVLYNIAIGRPGYAHWGRWLVFASFVATSLGTCVWASLAFQPHAEQHELVLILAIFTIGGIVLAASGITAVREACLGRPRMYAAVTITPNAAFLLGIALTWLWLRSAGAPTFSSVVPAIAWLLGTLATASVFSSRARKARASDQVLPTARSDSGGLLMQSAGLSLSALSGSVGPTIMLASLAALPTGSVFLANVVSRIGTAGVNLLVNSFLVVKLNWRERSAGLPRTVTYGAIATTALIGVGASVTALSGSEFLGALPVGLAWFIAIGVAAVTLRHLNAQRMVRTIAAKGATDAIAIVLLLAIVTHSPSVLGFFIAMTALQAVTQGFAGVAMRQWTLATAAILTVALCATTLVWLSLR